jgi:hypothetical protein
VQGKDHGGENENIFHPLLRAHRYQQIFKHHFYIIPMTGFQLQLKINIIGRKIFYPKIAQTSQKIINLSHAPIVQQLDVTGADGV